jgi:hypothetical protein
MRGYENPFKEIQTNGGNPFARARAVKFTPISFSQDHEELTGEDTTRFWMNDMHKKFTDYVGFEEKSEEKPVIENDVKRERKILSRR